ncbi:MAG: hypothetical protein JWN70_4292, partial [Planctomycetaceae bacterium]|nr:hypothetical protein [Planctomycetaceae bacterium]
ESDDPLVRHFAAKSLGDAQTKSPDAINKLKSLTRDGNPGVRAMAACALWSCTRSEADVLPVLVSSLDDEPSPIVLRYYTVPSASFMGQHLFVIGCLGEMARDSEAARAVLQRIVRRELPVRCKWNDMIQSLISAWGMAQYGTRKYLDAIIAIVEHEHDPLRPEALKLMGPGKLDEWKRQLAHERSWCKIGCARDKK